jgi:hypothetical protein
LLAIILPLSLIFTGTSKNAVDNLSSTTIQLAIDQASLSVSRTMLSTVSVLEGVTDNAYWTAVSSHNLHTSKFGYRSQC